MSPSFPAHFSTTTCVYLASWRTSSRCKTEGDLTKIIQIPNILLPAHHRASGHNCWCTERAGHHVTAQQGSTARPTWSALKSCRPMSRCPGWGGGRGSWVGLTDLYYPEVIVLPLHQPSLCTALLRPFVKMFQLINPRQNCLIFIYSILFWVSESTWLITDPNTTRTRASVEGKYIVRGWGIKPALSGFMMY